MKTILLAISGSIAFYKAYELISMFKKEDFKVKVLLSNGALKFASRLSFEALSDAVLSEENETWCNTNNHIDFTKDCDLILFAPASANSINKLALGIADTLFIQTLIAAKAPLIIAPAANTRMYLHFSTQNSLELLRKNKALIIEPISKTLACKEEGIGALANIETIFHITKRELLKKSFWQGKKVIITGGGTKEKIDDVRFVGNFSSGKMAKAMSDAFYFLGADVVLLSSLSFDTAYECKEFCSSVELKNLLHEYEEADFLLMAAAVADFSLEAQRGKLKKKDYPEGLKLELKPNEDLLANMNFKGKKVGFKMELDKEHALYNAKKALEEKKLDMICLNVLAEQNNFNSELNQLSFITKDKCVTSELLSKKELGFIVAEFCELL